MSYYQLNGGFMRKTISIITVIVLFISVSIMAQDAKIMTFPVSPYMIEHGEIDTTVYQTYYTGLKTVGVGDQVYLISANDAAAYAWSITSAPQGSAAALDDPTAKLVTFKPDVVGDYKVQLQIGTSTHEITIVASLYLGVENGACGICHSGTKNEWEGTGHSTIFTRAVNGKLSAGYSASCIHCHTVGYNEDPDAANGGFDDIAAQVGWTLPAQRNDGDWDLLDPALQNVSNVQCENCHGPASQHTATFNPAKMDVTIESGMCASCHDDGHYHRRPLMWSKSGHSRSTSISGATRSGCNDCHSGTRFIEIIDETPGIAYDAANTGAIGCAVCHDPHASHDNHDPMQNSAGQEDVQVHHLRNVNDIVLANGELVTIGGTGKLCMNCHKSRRDAESYVDESGVSSHFGPHHSTQTDMVLGTNAITFGRYIPSSTHRDVMPDFCVTCHMSETPGGRTGFGTYGRDEIGDHTFNMHWAGDDGILDTEDDAYNITICQSCHGTDKTSFDEWPARADYDGDGTVETAREELHGLLEEVEEFFPKKADGTVDYAANWNPIQKRALFNHAFVEEDYSMGMHNYQYAVGLLKITLEALNYGVLTKGEITRVADVPNDQGKQVYVSWTRFGGDGASNNPVTDYVVLRKDQLGLGKFSASYSDMDQVPGDINSIIIGQTIQDDGFFWTIVASTPAIQFLEYTMVVPTVADSSVNGMVETTFKVVGVTSNGLTAETDEAAGYSVDNLSPSVPTGLVGGYTYGTIRLDWNEAVDEDFKYFAVYRSNTQGFDPSELAPYTTVITNGFTDRDFLKGKKYYYRVAAVDFNGNKSSFSNELPVVITDLASEAGMPTEFVLYQNYPNPFNPATEIKFGVPEQADVKITVYNSVGKEIKVIVNENLAAGYYSYTFDASNLATGVYLYDITAGKFSQVKKMLLVK